MNSPSPEQHKAALDAADLVPGHYWVRLRVEWQIGRWSPFEALWRLDDGYQYVPAALEEIDPRRIVRSALPGQAAKVESDLSSAREEIAGLQAAMRAIIDRSNNREMGTGKVPDMREIAANALAGTSTGNPIDPMSASRDRIAALEAALKPYSDYADAMAALGVMDDGRVPYYPPIAAAVQARAVLSGGVGE